MFLHENGKLLFKYGRVDYEKAIEQALSCSSFVLDKDEDELVTSTEKNSCYNCLFRRWTKDSFTCIKS
ncbi:MAG: hypothetical protein ACJAWW_001634 [Sulfurimonas sp.]|jgi:hypothetical protein